MMNLISLRFYRLYFSMTAMLLFFSISPLHGAGGEIDLNFLTPKPTGNSIHDAWSPDGEHFYFSGDGGTILYFDGNTFTVMDTPTDCALLGIHGTSANDIWAVGGDYYEHSVTQPDRSVILHYNGTEWSKQPSPRDSFDQYHVLTDVWCDGAGTVWAVANHTTQIAQRSSNTWSYVDTGLSLSIYGFHGIYGFSPDDLYAVGGCGQIIHYHGGTWTLERKEGECTFSSHDLLYSVWGPDAENVFATGNKGHVVKRKSDGGWLTLYAGGLISDASKTSISGSSGSDVYFAGYDGQLGHWDGTIYTNVFDSFSDKSQNTIIRNTSGNYYIGFDYGKVSQFNGTQRSPLTTLPLADKNWKFVQRTDRIWLCTEDMRPGDTIYAWDGATLSAIDPGLSQSYLITVFKVFSENDVYLAGLPHGGFGAFATHYDGKTWSNINIGFNPLLDIVRSNSATFMITGSVWDDDFEGYFGKPCNTDANVCYNGDTFMAMAAGTDGKVYAVGKEGSIASYSNGAWSIENSGTVKDLTAVACGNGWVCAAGRDRTLLCKQDGGSWIPVTGLLQKDENKFIGIAHAGGSTFVAALNTGNDGSYSYIGADKGSLYVIENGVASLLQTGMSSSLGGICSNGNGEIAAAGSGGILFGDVLVPLEKKTLNPGMLQLLLLE